ncbi:nucleoside hydrolase [Candidatus Gracilibacteria bacterium]|nr:nucleoside hydrolase [Candidatus Gracilibacteria bacterium]
MKHIILDTDLGGDADDIFALLFAINSPELKIDLIVTSDEYKSHRARYTEEFLEMIDVKIPVVAGLDVGNTKLFVVENQIKDTKRKVDENFLEAIKQVVEKNEMTHYVCIGTQSNLAVFIKRYPHLKNKVKILFMGGAINYRKPNCAQHNIKYDVPPAIEVFHSDWDKKYVLSDVTFREEIKIDKQSQMYKELKKLNKKHTNFIIESMNSLFEKLCPETRMHDPLTLSYLINEQIIDFETQKITMNEKGIMKLSPDGRETIVSKKANYELFLEIFKERIYQDIVK